MDSRNLVSLLALTRETRKLKKVISDAIIYLFILNEYQWQSSFILLAAKYALENIPAWCLG